MHQNHLFKFLVLIYTLLYTLNTFSQSNVFGKITDQADQALPGVNILILNKGIGTTTDFDGNYSINIPTDMYVNIQFTYIGFETEKRQVYLRKDDVREINISLRSKNIILPNTIISQKPLDRPAPITRISPKIIEVLPSTTGGVEAILRTLPGVVANNELSSQYSVRGGNYDENLVYVNDFEIYRPFLIRSGQQEGLSFINPDLVSAINFSAGGFEAKYGDKMSSVLDIKYKKPHTFAASVGASLLGASAHIEGTALKKRMSFVLGARQKSNAYLLKALPTKGQYKPSFSDIQTFINYQIALNWQIQIIANYAQNTFRFVPEQQQTSFGTFNDALKLEVFYDGNEHDSYKIMMGGSGLVYTSTNNKLTLKLLGSAYKSNENEAFNIIGAYRIGSVEKNLGNNDFGNITRVLGVGAQHNWARNQLNANIYNVQHIGYLNAGKNFLNWGLKYQTEKITDNISEWSRLDSADFNIPYNGQTLQLQHTLKTTIQLPSNRYTAFIQNSWATGKINTISLTAGVRAAYWTVNEELIINPRLQLAFIPKLKRSNDTTNKAIQNDLLFRLSVGAYHQPPFYREIRNRNGEINKNVKSQKSIHIVIGNEYTFNIWQRPFKLTTEVYYKNLWDLIPYDVDNLLVRYFGQNAAKGYAWGIDTRLNGEFVSGIESWISASVMQTKEDIDNDNYWKTTNIFNTTGELIGTDSTYIEQKYLPRPTDQRFSFAMFFQDYLPNNKNFKMHLMLVVGTGLPFGPPNEPKFRSVFRIPPYRRVDIGFSALLFDKNQKELPEKSIGNKFNTIWASVEIFNLLGVKNTMSYNYVKALSSDYSRELIYAVPNFLTTRLLNAKILFKF